MKKCLFAMISAVIGGLLSGCKVMPAGDLIELSYTRSGTMAGYQWEGRVERDSDGTFVLRAMKENYGPLYEKHIGTEEMQKFRNIIEEEKMYAYKESYQPIFKVLDGWGWGFEAKFSDGNKIYSGGNNASPNGNGLDRIRGYMEELIQDGVLIETEEREY